VEVDAKQKSTRLGPGLPKSKNQLQVMYDHARKQQNRNFQTVADDFEELGNSQQTLTFRKNKLRHQNHDQEESHLQQDSEGGISQGEPGSQQRQWYHDDDDQALPHQAKQRVTTHTLFSDNDGSPANDMDERSSQKETIQLYASREVSNRLRAPPSEQDQQPTKQTRADRDVSPASQSLMAIKQRMNNSSTCSQTSLTKVNNRYKQ
jgi:hypothetical protein